MDLARKIRQDVTLGPMVEHVPLHPDEQPAVSASGPFLEGVYSLPAVLRDLQYLWTINVRDYPELNYAAGIRRPTNDVNKSVFVNDMAMLPQRITGRVYTQGELESMSDAELRDIAMFRDWKSQSTIKTSAIVQHILAWQVRSTVICVTLADAYYSAIARRSTGC